MVYLYAGLGVAMLAGIMAIFEMGLALTGNSLLPSPQDPYLINTDVKDEDKRWLNLLGDKDVIAQLSNSRGSTLCEALNTVYSERLAVSAWSMDTLRMPIKKGPWAGSCLMNHGDHRIVVRPPDPTDIGYLAPKYSLYSCILQDEICPFEKVQVEESP